MSARGGSARFDRANNFVSDNRSANAVSAGDALRSNMHRTQARLVKVTHACAATRINLTFLVKAHEPRDGIRRVLPADWRILGRTVSDRSHTQRARPAKPQKRTSLIIGKGSALRGNVSWPGLCRGQRNYSFGNCCVFQPPPSALINRTLASSCRRMRSMSLRWLARAAVCEVTTSI
jgi:hypothetical protein